MYGYSLVLSSSLHTDKCIDKLEGASLTIILDSPKQDGDALIWKCDDKVIYERKRGKESTFPANVNNNGSLILTNLIPSMSCTYKAEHHDKVGKLMKKVTERLCVLRKYYNQNYTTLVNSLEMSFHMCLTVFKVLQSVLS